MRKMDRLQVHRRSGLGEGKVSYLAMTVALIIKRLVCSDSQEGHGTKDKGTDDSENEDDKNEDDKIYDDKIYDKQITGIDGQDDGIY
jgi:hypothetical protein